MMTILDDADISLLRMCLRRSTVPDQERAERLCAIGLLFCSSSQYVPKRSYLTTVRGLQKLCDARGSHA